MPDLDSDKWPFTIHLELEVDVRQDGDRWIAECPDLDLSVSADWKDLIDDMEEAVQRLCGELIDDYKWRVKSRPKES